MPYCVAFDCDNSTDKSSSKGVSFHRFPVKNSNLLKEWLANLKLKNPPIHDQNARVCSAHFQPECFASSLRQELLSEPTQRRLRKDAVPTIFSFTVIPKPRECSERRLERKRLKDILYETDDDETDDLPTNSADNRSIGIQTGINNITETSFTQNSCSYNNACTSWII